MENKNSSRFLAVFGFPAVLLSLVLIAIIFRDELLYFFSSPERLKAWTEQWGIVSPLVFIGIQFLQVVIFFIPGEIPQIAGGYIFGIVPGILYSAAGICLGSAFNYMIAKLLGVPFVIRVFGRQQFDKFEHVIMSPKAIATFFLLFLIPGIPKDVLCYVAGLSLLRFRAFLWISMAGRVPGLLGSVMIGNFVAEQRWLFGGIVLAFAAVFFILGLVFREKMFRLVVSISIGKKEAAAIEEPSSR